MNKKRRTSLRSALDLLLRALGIVESVVDEERDSLWNMPQNLEASEQYRAMEDAIDEMTSAIDNINAASESIERAADA